MSLGSALSQLGGSQIGHGTLAVGVDHSGLDAGLAQASAKVNAAGNGWSKAFTAAKLAIGGLALGLAAFTVDAIKSAEAFDTAMGKVYALTGVSKQALEGLSQGVLDLSTRVPDSAEKLAQGLYFVISAGFSGSDAMKVLELSAKDAAAGMTDTQTVADGLTSAIKAYGKGAESAAHFSDIMTNTVTQGKMEWGDLARVIGPGAATASAAGVSFEELSSAIATMTRQGMTARRSVQGINFLIRDLIAPNDAVRQQMAALGIAYDENTLKQKGLIGVLQMFGEAAKKHLDVVVKDTKGNIDWEKSVAATKGANTGWFDRMKTLTGGAAGLMASLMILNNGAKDYTQILGSMSEAQGLSNEAFERMKSMNVGMAFDIMRNKIQVVAIEFGKTLLPKLADAALWLGDTIPAALRSLGTFWDTYLAKPIGGIVSSLGGLATALYDTFIGWTQGKEGAGNPQAGRQLVDGLGRAMGTLAGYAKTAVDALKTLFSNPVVQGLARLTVVLLGVKAAASFFGTLGANTERTVRSLTSKGLNAITFGRYGGTTAATTQEDLAAKALTGSAGKLDAAGASLETAAAALKGAAIGGAVPLGAGAGLPAAVTRRGPVAGPMPIPWEPAAIPRTISPVWQTAETIATPATGWARAIPWETEAAMVGAQAKMGTRQMLSSVATSTRAGITEGLSMAKTGLTGGASMLKTGLSGALGLASKAFWPALIGSLAIDFAKEPLGDLVSKQFGLANVGEKMKTDFFGGIADWFTSVLSTGGNDAWVGHAAETHIGSIKVGTMELAKIGIDSATIDKLQGTEGSIGQAQSAASTAKTIDWSSMKGQDLLDLASKNGVDTSWVRSGEGNALGPDQALYGNYNKDDIKKLAQQLAEKGIITTAQDLRAKVSAALLDPDTYDIPASAVGVLSDAQIDELATLIQGNTAGEYDAIIRNKIASWTGANATQIDQVLTGKFAGGKITGPGAGAKPIAAPKDLGKGADIDVVADGKGGYVIASGKYKGYRIGATQVTNVTGTGQTAAEMSASSATGKQAAASAQMGRAGVGSLSGTVPGITAELNKQGQAITNSAVALQKAADAKLTQVARQSAMTAGQKLGLTGNALATYIADNTEVYKKLLLQGAQDYVTAWGPTIDKVDTALKTAHISSDSTLADLIEKDTKLPDATKTLISNMINAGIVKPGDTWSSVDKVLTDYANGLLAQDSKDKLAGDVTALQKYAMAHGVENWQTDPEAPKAIAGAISDVSRAALASLTGDNSNLATFFQSAGDKIMGWLGIGIQNNTSAAYALNSKLWGMKGMLPESPVKGGPLKHPFLPNAGRKIMEQLAEGMTAAGPLTPSLKLPTGKRGGLGGSVDQTIYADTINLGSPAEETSAINSLAALAPLGR